MTHFDSHAQSIARRQYFHKGDERREPDQSIPDMFWRIANHVAGAELEAERAHWAQKYYDLMHEKKFCPGGRIMAGAGTIHGQLLNCFVQGATDHTPESFEGVMEVAKKFALVTKVGGGNGVNLDPYLRGPQADTDAGVVGVVYMSAEHPDVMDFIGGMMRPPTQPDGDKQPVALRNFRRVIYGTTSADVSAAARAAGVRVVAQAPAARIHVPDDMGGIMDAATQMLVDARSQNVVHIDISAMRPEGTPIRGSGGTSSGPVSFVFEIFDNFLQWHNAGAEHSGPVATLRYVYAPVLRVVRQGGSRRGAGMATISVNHPGVLDFLTSKDTDRETAEGDISTFNISILITASFWESLQRGEFVPVGESGPDLVPGKYAATDLEEHLQNGALSSQWLWKQIAEHAWSTGEPGLIFVDRINEFSAISALGEQYVIKSTNPCGEIPLTVGEPCDLGAINLAAYVQNKTFDEATFRADIRTAVRFLDDVLDVNVFPLEQNRTASHTLRRLGLGIMGLADALIKLGQRYDSQAGRDTITHLMTVLREEAVAASETLGRERGVYPLYAQHNKRGKGPIPHGPRRNVAVLTVAPTGTTSMLMGVSSGIEPVFSPFIWRKIGKDYVAMIAPLFQELLETHPAHPSVAKDGNWDWDKVTDAISNNHGSVVGLEFVPQDIQNVFVCAHDIAPLDHVRMQGAVQRAFDAGQQYAANSLSKTINLPNHATIEDVQAAYAEAYETGCKGITVYRDGSRQFQVLSTSKAPADVPAWQQELNNLLSSGQIALVANDEQGNPTVGVYVPTPAETPQPERSVGPVIKRAGQRLLGTTDHVYLTNSVTQEKRTFLVTVNYAGSTQPMEVILTAGRAGDESNADSEALGRLVSIALQFGVPPLALSKTLQGISSTLFGTYNGRLISSKAALIAAALEDAARNGIGHSNTEPVTAPQPPVSAPGASVPGGQHCPSCKQQTLVREEGCYKCQSCGYSKCG